MMKLDTLEGIVRVVLEDMVDKWDIADAIRPTIEEYWCMSRFLYGLPEARKGSALNDGHQIAYERHLQMQMALRAELAFGLESGSVVQQDEHGVAVRYAVGTKGVDCESDYKAAEHRFGLTAGRYRNG